MQHLLSQNLSPAQDFPTFCVQAALRFRFESEGVMGCFDSKIFPKSKVYRIEEIHKGPFLCTKMLEDAENLDDHDRYS